MDILHVRWQALHGSVFTEQSFPVKLEFKRTVELPLAIALNVGKDIAEHMVMLHNQSLERNG